MRKDPLSYLPTLLKLKINNENYSNNPNYLVNILMQKINIITKINKPIPALLVILTVRYSD